VILDPDAYDLWLDPGMKDVAVASELLKPFDARLTRCYPVSTRLNNATNDDQECCTPVEPPQMQSRLFAHSPFSTPQALTVETRWIGGEKSYHNWLNSSQSFEVNAQVSFEDAGRVFSKREMLALS
jgi:hypothetical protein